MRPGAARVTTLRSSVSGAPVRIGPRAGRPSPLSPPPQEQRIQAMSDSMTLPETTTRPKEKEEHKTKRQPPYNVILHNDDDHSFEYVIRMLQRLFGYPPEKGFLMAW